MLSEDKKVLVKCYQLSKGNPIEDTMDMFANLQQQVEEQGATLEVLGVGTTGYAKDILKDVIGADVALVETVAHTEAGLHFYPGTDVIVDVGGQDIKVIILRNGQVKDFKLNTQCSAGNGYFLQSTAAGFGFDVRDYADIAFDAQAMPSFGYGCAVFMQSDIVDFQRQGWQAGEIMAGLADVLPKNIWLYVSQIPNLPKLGSKFLLQGGTQHNLAAVKSQVDFVESRFAGTGIKPDVRVHLHCGESGAIGCAIESHRLYHELDVRTQFIGIDAVKRIKYRTTREEKTRCYFCKNKCLRTFIDVATTDQPSAEQRAAAAAKKTKVPLKGGEQRLIIATCEKGEVEDVAAMRQIKSGLDALMKSNPNLVSISAKAVWRPVSVANVADALVEIDLRKSVGAVTSALRDKLTGIKDGANGTAATDKTSRMTRAARLFKPLLANVIDQQSIKQRREAMERRQTVRIGVPRVLNMYSQQPFFSGYFQSLGIPARNLIYSDFTNEELYKEGAKRGSIDPCFPSKVGIPHVHNLLYRKHTQKAPVRLHFLSHGRQLS